MTVLGAARNRGGIRDVDPFLAEGFQLRASGRDAGDDRGE